MGEGLVQACKQSLPVDMIRPGRRCVEFGCQEIWLHRRNLESKENNNMICISYTILGGFDFIMDNHAVEIWKKGSNDAE